MNRDEKYEILKLATDFNEITASPYSKHVRTTLEKGSELEGTPQSIIDTLLQDFDKQAQTQFKVNALLSSIDLPPMFPKVNDFFNCDVVGLRWGSNIAEELEGKIDEILGDILQK